MVIPPVEGGLKEAQYQEKNIIISDSVLRNILPPQLNKMLARHKVMWAWVLHTYQDYALLFVEMA